MKTLITGAGGFLGGALARRLCAGGHAVRALVRPGASSAALDGLPVELARGDVTDPGTLRAAFEGIDVVHHLAGIRRAPSREDFLRVNAGGTRAVCEAMAAAGCRRLVLASSITAMGPRTDFPDESAPLAPADWNGESKREAERVAREYAGRFEVVVARPTRLLGPGDRESRIFFEIVRRGWVLAFGRAPRPISVIDVEDVAEAFALLGAAAPAAGGTFFVSAATTTVEAIQREVARALDLRTRTLWIPDGLLRGLAAGADAISSLSGRRLPLNRKMAQQLLAAGWTCSTKAIEQQLGFKARFSVRESIERMASDARRR